MGWATDPACCPAPLATSRRMSFIGSADADGGMTSKLFAGGGDWVNHSSVFPCHGSLPARLPFLIERMMFTTETSTPMPSRNEPIVEMRL